MSFNKIFGQSLNDTTILKMPRAAWGDQIIPKFYTFYQSEHETYFQSPSHVYMKIPGLSFAVHHAQPAVYELTFQGVCRGDKQWTGCFRHFMIDDHILIANQLLPNTDRRQAASPALGVNMHTVDARDGGMSYNGDAGPLYYGNCFKFDVVHLPPGVHTINVGYRTESKGTVIGGTLIVKLTQYPSSSHINLEPPTVKY